jgi:hypothetical protein
MLSIMFEHYKHVELFILCSFSGTIPEGMAVLPTNDKLKHHKR